MELQIFPPMASQNSPDTNAECAKLPISFNANPIFHFESRKRPLIFLNTQYIHSMLQRTDIVKQMIFSWFHAFTVNTIDT